MPDSSPRYSTPPRCGISALLADTIKFRGLGKAKALVHIVINASYDSAYCQLSSTSYQLTLPRIHLVFINAFGMHHIAFTPARAIRNKEVDPDGTGNAHERWL